MESLRLRISLGYPVRKYLLKKQRQKTAKANPRKKWNAVSLAQMPTIASSQSCYSCVLAIADVVGKGEEANVNVGVLEKWQRTIDIVKEILKPAPNSPAAGGDLTGFFSASAILLLIFWLGNYVVPDIIFKDTIFKKIDSTDDGTESSVVAPKEKLATNKDLKRERKAVGFGSKIKSKKNQTKC
ncbi:hypothetical protein SUGI_0515880 [Cryptomeria japonica]|uniref:uncharacterized protein LOC131069785 n=1 Tax=Cryptomeria japonica TaxID=3369 RepID=UPI002408CD55|nr:uncharacterized protein LOC131069785 [Cryptomeria japonica]GLJ26592.1 hypothetical protein SUGI_0515880 [Cryptomeria japonica]